MIYRKHIAGVILAGGKASRLGYRDKPLLPLAGRPIIEHIIERATPEVGELMISVNRNPELYQYLELPTIADSDNAFSGPLVGIASAMAWIKANRAKHHYSHLACFAGDVPSFPQGIVSRLAAALTDCGSALAISQNNGQIQPLFSLWKLDSLATISSAISEGLFGPKLILARMEHTIVEINDCSARDFANINTQNEWRIQEDMHNIK